MAEKENYPPLRHTSEEDFKPVEITAKLTDKEIIKSLECCISNSDCSACVFLGSGVGSKTTCEVKMIKSALVLINRQQAEIENSKNILYLEEGNKKLQAEIERLQIRLRKERHQFEDVGKMYDVIKAEAIKEICERLHTEINRLTGDIVQKRSERLDQIESSDIVIPFDSVLHGYNSKLEAYNHINGFVDLQYKEMVGEV